jgi:hypothetical protein
MIPAINKEDERGAAIKQTDFNIPKSLILMFLALATLFFIDGCMPYHIPTPEHGYKDQKAVTKDMVKQLEPGTTTKNDVEVLLENFAILMTGDSVYCYYWTRIDGYYGVLWLGTDDSYSEHRSSEDLHAFCLEFMPDDKLKRFKHFESGGGNVHQQIEDWENEKD